MPVLYVHGGAAVSLRRRRFADAYCYCYGNGDYHGNSYSHSDSYPYADRYANGHSNSYSYTDRYADGHSHRPQHASWLNPIHRTSVCRGNGDTVPESIRFRKPG